MVQPFRCQGQSQPSAKEGANLTSAIRRSSGGRCCYLASYNCRTADRRAAVEEGQGAPARIFRLRHPRNRRNRPKRTTEPYIATSPGKRQEGLDQGDIRDATAIDTLNDTFTQTLSDTP